MKKFVIIVFSFYIFKSYSQLNIYNSLTPDQIVNDVLVGQGVTASNIIFTGDPLQIGAFSGYGTNLNLDSGIVLSTGSVLDAPGPNDNEGKTTSFNNPGDPALSTFANHPTKDAVILEFDFVPASDTLKIVEYVFASEEYEEFVGSSCNDVFAFFISGPNGLVDSNIALIPGTNTPISVNTINNGSEGSASTLCGISAPELNLNNSQYYVDNYGGALTTVQFDGFTTVMEAKLPVTPNLTYHAKLAIADGEDDQWDAAVFLRWGSFSSTDDSTDPVVADITIPNVFTPNGDGLNDLLAFKGLDKITENTLTVYNRWGQVLYEKKSYNNDWNGEELTDGTYYYVLNIDKKEEKHGFFSVFGKGAQ